jgi:hypothetical protein
VPGGGSGGASLPNGQSNGPFTTQKINRSALFFHALQSLPYHEQMRSIFVLLVLAAQSRFKFRKPSAPLFTLAGFAFPINMPL